MEDTNNKKAEISKEKRNRLLELTKEIMTIINTEYIDNFFEKIKENEEFYKKIKENKNIKAPFFEYL